MAPSAKSMQRPSTRSVRTRSPQREGGYGKPLGNKGGRNLTGLLKVKLRGAGLRIVYALERRDEEMVIVIVGARADNEVYDIAAERWDRYARQ